MIFRLTLIGFIVVFIPLAYRSEIMLLRCIFWPRIDITCSSDLFFFLFISFSGHLCLFSVSPVPPLRFIYIFDSTSSVGQRRQSSPSIMWAVSLSGNFSNKKEKAMIVIERKPTKCTILNVP